MVGLPAPLIAARVGHQRGRQHHRTQHRPALAARLIVWRLGYDLPLAAGPKGRRLGGKDLPAPPKAERAGLHHVLRLPALPKAARGVVDGPAPRVLLRTTPQR